VNDEEDFREVVLKDLQECFFGSLIPFWWTLGACDFLDLSLYQRLEQRNFIAHFVELIDSSIPFSWHYLLKEIDANDAQNKEE
jgi:hypothetical protein